MIFGSCELDIGDIVYVRYKDDLPWGAEYNDYTGKVNGVYPNSNGDQVMRIIEGDGHRVHCILKDVVTIHNVDKDLLISI